MRSSPLLLIHCTYCSCPSYLSYIKCNPPLCFEQDAVNGNKFQSHPLHSDPILAIPPHFQHSLPTLAYLVKLAPLTQTTRGEAKERSPNIGNEKHDIQQKQAVWVLQHNGVLKHRLYETPDAKAQTYEPQTSNKKYKNMDIVSKWSNA